MIRVMNVGVDTDMTTSVNIARAVFTNSMLKVRANTCRG